MKEIPLTQGKTALVDDDDYDLVNAHKWHATYAYGGWYARRWVNKQPAMMMHRMITQAQRGEMIDHRNGNSLDNQKCNLRRASNSQNQQNRHRLVTNTSGYRGVTFIKKANKWQAGIKLQGKSYHLGWHLSPEAAARAYDAKAQELFGEFAQCNFKAA